MVIGAAPTGRAAAAGTMPSIGPRRGAQDGVGVTRLRAPFGPAAICGRGRLRPRTSITRRAGSSRKTTWCSPTSLKSSTTRTTSSRFWPMRTCSSRPSPTGKRALGEVRVEPRADEVDPQPVGRVGAVVLDAHLALDVDHHARRGLAAPRAQVEDAREAGRRGLGSGLAGSRSRSSAFAAGRAAAFGVGLEVGAGGVAELAPLAGLARDLDGGPERVVAEAARRVLGDQRPVGGERVVAVAGRLEALRHLAVERRRRDERVVAVAGARIARDHLAVAQHHRLPLRALRHAPRGRAQPRLGGLRVLVERFVGARRLRHLADLRRSRGQPSGSSSAQAARPSLASCRRGEAQLCQVSTVS